MNDYRKHGKWVGNASLDLNCTNPKALFESIVTKPEDIISYITYGYFDKSETTFETEKATSVSSNIMSHVDIDNYGRCYTFSPTEKMIKSGINKIIVGIRKKLIIYFHTNGMFEKGFHDDITQMLALPSKEMFMDLDFIVYKMLDFGGLPCETEPEFNQDYCTKTKLDKKSLEMFGCTTPFGTNKEKICQDHEIGFKVMDMYRETMEKNIDNCYSPCSFLSMKAIKISEYYGNGFVYIKLKENIQVFEAQYLYSILSMIAEVGGYVGLFLGVSVNQISTIFNIVLDRFEWIFKKSKRTY